MKAFLCYDKDRAVIVEEDKMCKVDHKKKKTKKLQIHCAVKKEKGI